MREIDYTQTRNVDVHGVPKKLTSLKRHSLARKQHKSRSYRLSEIRKSNLKIRTKFVNIGGELIELWAPEDKKIV